MCAAGSDRPLWRFTGDDGCGGLPLARPPGGVELFKACGQTAQRAYDLIALAQVPLIVLTLWVSAETDVFRAYN
jgi:hypothetical protein